jgi:hypothetical protein
MMLSLLNARVTIEDERLNVTQHSKVKPAHMVTSIKQSPVLKGHPFLVVS